ncbi:hypothetical protein VCR31J2_1290062 [Vibrio coralliirubri]|uniref:Uncharacterized protein n=1 Tax=Vibrio coralliirubri TaxID=1516159 RepID=A0AA87C0U7_9VIBR|nr:hypothetical protein VCR31J2_1290062 [Vibrio coralliirubri]
MLAKILLHHSIPVVKAVQMRVSNSEKESTLRSQENAKRPHHV